MYGPAQSVWATPDDMLNTSGFNLVTFGLSQLPVMLHSYALESFGVRRWIVPVLALAYRFKALHIILHRNSGT